MKVLTLKGGMGKDEGRGWRKKCAPMAAGIKPGTHIMLDESQLQHATEVVPTSKLSKFPWLQISLGDCTIPPCGVFGDNLGELK